MSQSRWIRIPRTDGRSATIRVDGITALMPNVVKDKAEVTIQLGPTLMIHTPLTEAQVVKLMAQASGQVSFPIVDWETEAA